MNDEAESDDLSELVKCAVAVSLLVTNKTK